ncbi:hypothetical protein P10VF_118 [Rhizobium phage vB_RleM_P10VF]|uniref:Uncharacterized protein n=2 Tax=Innesvirus TaxID=3044739 RepID=A0A6B9J3F8_9CAUD|nr:hypothetical protein P10VF_118 [Rhizobium phage vB_RleM_P10VF]YP_010662415.1 hypothetical protein PP939_gp007 [Rhizobium phage RL38J1]AIK68331.1 hypothetical protein P10VF_118 [Rhizobium phage vB_RleM_P10VF]QGZ13998.1 hypothetical protein RL38J1_007 [Rhizobium phage RL38J1]
MTDEYLDLLKDFEKSIVEHWTDLNERSIEPIDFVDALTDFFSRYPNVDPEDVKFSDAFVNRLKIDADKRRLLVKSNKDKKSDEISLNSNELEI